jgi:hypothetical protein
MLSVILRQRCDGCRKASFCPPMVQDPEAPTQSLSIIAESDSAVFGNVAS